MIIYNQLHTIENARRVCYLKAMGMQGIMVRIHCIVVQKFGCIVGRNKKCLSLSTLGLLVPCSLASGSGGSNIEDLYFNFHLLTFPSFHFARLLIFHAVADLRNSSISAKSREIRKKTRFTAKSARNISKCVSAKHI